MPGKRKNAVRMGRGVVVIAVCMGWSAAPRAQDPGVGQPEQQETPQPREQARPQARQRARVPTTEGLSDVEKRMQKEREVRGQIIKIKTVELRGLDARNTVVMLKTNRNDQRLIVDLGPEPQLEALELDIGDELAAAGNVVRTGDKQYLVATKLKTKGQLSEIDRSQQAKQHQQRLRAQR